jgi:hypothetical protein
MRFSENMILVLSLAAVACVSLAGFALYAVFFKQMAARRALMREVSRKFKGVSIIASTGSAFFQGLDRSWDRSWRGRGSLVLTDRMLYFRLLERTLDLAIPLGRIREVMLDPDGRKDPESKEFGVSYLGSDDQPRVASWIVRRPGKWARAIEEALDRAKEDDQAKEKHIPQDEDA